MNPHQHTQQPITTGATVLAVKYKDGIMMAADTMVAYGSSLRFASVGNKNKATGEVDLETSRIHPCGVNNATLVAASGEFSDFQYIRDRLVEETSLEDYCEQDGVRQSPKETAQFLGRVLYNKRTKMDPYWNQLVVGGFDTTGSGSTPSLHYVDLQGTVFEEDYLATGFGMHLALPLLRKYWSADMSEGDARALLKKCLAICFYRDCKASCKIQIAISTKDGGSVGKEEILETKWDHSAWTKTGAEVEAGDSW